jgi:hypothetical protein
MTTECSGGENTINGRDEERFDIEKKAGFEDQDF